MTATSRRGARVQGASALALVAALAALPGCRSGSDGGAPRAADDAVRASVDGAPPEACPNGATAAPCLGPAEPTQVVPGRIIVRFRDTLAEPADLVHAHGARFADVARAGGADLDRLAAEYRVRSVTPVFRALFEGAPTRLGQGAARERHRRVAQAVSRAKAAFPARARRAPAGAEVPDLTRVYAIEADPDVDVQAMARAFRANPNVESAVPDGVATVSAATNDPYLASSSSFGQGYADLWALHRIRAPAAWDLATGEGIVVAVVDTGLDATHPDIAANVWTNAAEASGVPGVDDDGNGYVDDVRGWDFYYSDADPSDGYGHGTHVAGTIAATGGNALGIVGVAYRARIMALKGMDDQGYSSMYALSQAIAYAARNGADVINNSWGCKATPAVPDMCDIPEAFALARALGAVVVVSAGNDGTDVEPNYYPARVPDVLTVSATGQDDAPSWFTNFGWTIDVAAPGGGPSGPGTGANGAFNILSLRAAGTGEPTLLVGSGYLRNAGTSMAAPHVSGVAALVLSRNPALTLPEVEAVIRHSAVDLVGSPAVDTPGYDPHYGWGRIDAAAAVALALTPPADPPILKVLGNGVSFDVPASACPEDSAFPAVDGPVQLYNLGGGAMPWSASAPGWLAVAPAAGSGRATVRASATRSQSATGVLTIDAPDAVGGRIDLPVTERVAAGVRLSNCRVPIGTAALSQKSQGYNGPPAGIPDGAGGAFIAFNDDRTRYETGVFVQRVDARGQPLWTQDGVSVAAGGLFEQHPAIVSDGAGGVIVSYVVGSYAESWDVWVQRIDASGQRRWGNGVRLCYTYGSSGPAQLVSDGAGGAIVAWGDERDAATKEDIYVQHVTAAGTPTWTANGVRLTSALWDQGSPRVVPDGSGGAILAWVDYRTAGAGGFPSIYAQRVDASGRALWTPDGVRIADTTWANPMVAPDGAGGAIVAWDDATTSPANVRAVRLGPAGTNLWAAGGVPVTQGRGYRAQGTTFAPDGRGGLFFAWIDQRTDLQTFDVYAQRFDALGRMAWAASGVPVGTARGDQWTPTVVSDGSDGALVAWEDLRGGDGDVFLQRLGPDGARRWPAGGVGIDGKPGDQLSPHLVQLGGRGYLLTWDDRGVACDVDGQCTDVIGKVVELDNALPVAQNAWITVAEDASASVTLSATDAEGAPLTYAVVQAPAHGTLSGTAPSLTYTPAPDYAGADAFTFQANDGGANSNVATVTITVTPVNDVPVAAAQSVAALENRPVAVTLAASDVDGDALTYAVVTGPSHGALSGTPPALTYTPAAGWVGADAFTFRASDGRVSSNIATVSIDVAAVDDPPVASPLAIAATEDTPVAVTLVASDPEGAPLAYAVVDGPSHGILSGATPALTYTPAADYAGSDAFTFRANDGTSDSNVATVTVTVAPVNDPPVASPLAIAATEDEVAAVTLAGTDVEGDALSFSVVAGPAHGTLSGTAPALTYTPAANYAGADAFTFRASDGTDWSAPATVTITVAPVNDPPVATPQSVAATEDTPVAVTLTGTDAEGAPLAYEIVEPPAHGTLSGTAPSLTYVPAPNYGGPDAFRFRVSDGEAVSGAATVAIAVAPVNDFPTALGQAVSAVEDHPVPVMLTGEDVDGDPLTYEIVDDPAHGTVSGFPPAVTYTPAADWSGTDVFTFRVSDGRAWSTPAPVTVTVSPRNDPPVAGPVRISTLEDTPVAVVLSASDPDSAALVYSVVTGPAHGTLSGTAPALTYTPDPDWAGADGFTFVVFDGSDFSAPAAVTIAVEPVNDLPAAVGQSVAATEDTPASVTLAGSDVDGDALAFEVIEGPAHGALSGAPPALTYTPARDYSGPDAFTFAARDGAGASPAATVTIDVAPVNDAPVASDAAFETPARTAVAVTLSATDVERDPLAYRILSAPSHGTLTGSAPELTYAPASGFAGEDVFTFVASDGVADSAPGTVRVAVLAAPPAPAGGCGCTTGADAAPIAALVAVVALRRVRRGRSGEAGR